MPNLRAIIERQQLMANLNSRLWVAVVLILFGVIQDGGGVVIKPGGGPIPIDPWGPLNLGPSMHKRDVLAALAMTEMASLLTDESSRKALTRASLDAISNAVEHMRGTG